MDTHIPAPAAVSGLKQPYHLVDPSPWPMLASLGAGLIVFGIVMAAHYGSYIWLELGFAITVVVAGMWWRDVLRESRVPANHTPVVRLGLRYGMTLFIASEVMFFVGFFWAFFHFALYPEHVLDVVNPTWPPPGITTFDPFHLPFLNTMILLLSGCTVTWAHHALIENDRRSLVMALGARIFRCTFQVLGRRRVSVGVLPGDRVPWFPCHHRHHLPDRLLVPGQGWAVHPQQALRLRGCGLVLALR
jgi:cytochrome c oxidase subunit 3